MEANAAGSALSASDKPDSAMSGRRRARPLWRPGSLRLRLTLWYGVLVVLALSLFVVLVPALVTDAISRSVDDAVRAEARVAQIALTHELTPNLPYWPAHLTLDVVDAYRSPGVTVTVLDTQGQIRYRSAGSAAPLPLTTAASRVAASPSPIWYTTKVEGERVRVEALPIHARSSSANSPTAGPIIGILLVGKSLSDVDATLRLLRTLLLLTGLAVLLAALLGGWAIASHVLHPLAEIGSTARAIAAGVRNTRISSLHRRIRRPPGDDELAQVVDTLNEMLSALDSSSAAQRRFVADASHELRAPLTTIQGNLAFLLRHTDEIPADERRTTLADAHGETLHLAHLVNDLLLLARADAGGDAASHTDDPITGQENREPTASPPTNSHLVTHASAPVELDRIILQLVRQLRGRLRAEGSPLTIDIGTITPARVRADEETLRRIVLILLDNAIKYTPTDTEHPASITVSLERADGQAIVRVRDTGIGIDRDDLQHIFERFYRADRARTRQGTGLGLAIARTLVERLGGHITAESSPGQGTTFSVTLPLV